MSTEKVYDEQISPLMDQIIKICQENNIHYLASFGLKGEDGEDIGCTSTLTKGESHSLTTRYRQCAAFICGKTSPVVAITASRKPRTHPHSHGDNGVMTK